MKSTIATKIGVPLLMLSLSGVAALWTFSQYIRKAGASAALEHQLLSQRLQVELELARSDDTHDRLALQERMQGFEQFLSVLERGGEVLGRRVEPASRKELPQIRRLRARWEATKPALERLAAGEPQERARSYADLIDRLAELGAASQELLKSFEAQRESFQHRAAWVLRLLSLLDAALLAAGAFVVVRHVIQPVRRVQAVALRVQAGDFSQRLPVTTSDELATLARSFNQMSAHVSQLLELIEAERRSAQASEQRLREMVQDLDAVVWEADPDTLQFSFVSQRAETLLGYPLAQWLEEPDFWARHLHPEDRDWAVEFCRKVARQSEFEYRMVAADGRIVWVREQVRLSTFGPLTRLRGLIMDITRARAADLALHQSEATNRALLNAIPDLVLRVRRDGTCVDFRGAHNVPLFLDPAELIGKTIAQALPPVAAQAMACLERAFLTGQPQMYECTLPAGGGQHDFEARVAAAGPEEALVMIRNITQRKRAEEAVRSAEAELRRVLASVSDCLWSAELDSPEQARYVYYSPVSARISGRPPEYYRTPEDWLATLHPEDRPRLEESMRRISGGQSAREEEEYRVIWPDGGVRWVRSTVMRRSDGGRTRLDGADADITAHKLADEALRQAKQALEAIVDASPLPIYATDLRGHVTRWNAAAERVFGWTEPEVLGRRLPFVPEDELEGFYSRLAEARAGATLAGWEATRRTKDGSALDLSVWTAILRDAAGAPSGFIGITVDVTERKRLEQQLRQSQKMEAVGRLAGGVAHDFNNLLTVITGYAYMLLDDLEPEHPLRGNAEEILRAVERASTLTNQLLAFSRRQIAQPKPIDLNALVINMDKMLRRVIGEDIELVTALCPHLGQVKADPGQLEQVIMNLVVNSRDALPSGGRLSIETANVTLDEAYARVQVAVQPGAYVLLAVSDNGVGMDAATKAHLFEPFFTTKQQGKGTGLGLSTVYGIVKQSGGEIAVDSEPDVGTRVSIYLPRIDEPAAPAEPLAGGEAQVRGNETVLVVEDEAEVRHLVREVLRQQGYTILEAGHPEEALAICTGHAGLIHLMLTDVVMPQMSGRELAERAGWLRSDMKVLFMSGYTEDVKLLGGEEPRPAFLKKPFTPAALARKIREMLDE